jgi:hypothetical protein
MSVKADDVNFLKENSQAEFCYSATLNVNKSNKIKLKNQETQS